MARRILMLRNYQSALAEVRRISYREPKQWSVLGSSSLSHCPGAGRVGTGGTTPDHRGYDVKLSGLSQHSAAAFHTSPRRNIPPLFWLFFKPVAKVASMISGRYLRKWWKKLPESEKGDYKRKLNLSKGKIAAAVALLVAAGAINYATHIQEAPITGRKRYVAFTREQFLKIASFGFQLQWELNKSDVVKPDHPIYNMVTRVAQRIVDSNQDLEFMRDQKWTVIVVDKEEENAFVLPTGQIFVNTGMMKAVDNDDQLAVILGHEMAHALCSHGAEHVSFAQLLDVLIILVMAFLWAFIPSDGIAIITQWFYHKVVEILLCLPYSRKLEAEADEVGLYLIAKACYDVRESSQFWSLMMVKDQVQNGEVEMPEWLSTHPANEHRAKALDEKIPKAIDLRNSCNCPRLPSTDPRQQTELLRLMLKSSKTQTEPEAAKGATVKAPVPAAETGTQPHVVAAAS